MRDRLLHLINTRLMRYTQFHDVSDILDEELREAALSLLELLGEETTDTQAVLAVAKVFWLRYNLLPEGQDEADFRQALVLYRAIQQVMPEAVPDSLRRLVQAGPRPVMRVNADQLEQVGAQMATSLAAAVKAGDREMISAFILGFRQLLRMLPPNYPKRSIFASTLAAAYGSRYNLSADPNPEDLDAQIAILESTTTSADVPDGNLAFQLQFLGDALEKRHGLFHRPADLDSAITARQESLSLTAPGSEHHGTRAYRLGRSLLAHASRSMRLPDLDDAVAALQAACSAGDESPERGSRFYALGDALLRRYNGKNQAADLEAAIVAFGTAHRAAPAGTPQNVAYLLASAHALVQRHALLGNASDCNKAAELLQQALPAQPGTGAFVGLHAALLSGLGLALKERYLAVGKPDDLLGMARAFRMSASQSRSDARFRAGALSGLANTMSLLHRTTGDEAHRMEAIRAYTEIAESIAADQDQRESARAALARLQQRGQGAPLPELTAHCEALAEEAKNARYQYRADRNLNDLNRAITFTKLLARQEGAAAADHVSRLIMLSNDMCERYDRTGWRNDVAEALTVAKKASQAAVDARSLAAALCTEANAWLANSRATGDPGSLERAIAAAARSIQQAPDGDTGRAWAHNALGNGLMCRYEKASDIRDARRGVDEFRQALALIDQDEADRVLVLNNLASALRSIHDQTKDIDMLVEAIDTLKEAAAGGKPSVEVLVNLGNAYMNLFQLSARPVDAGRARRAYEQALDELPPSDTAYSVAVFGLFEAVRSAPDPEPESLRHTARCVESLIENHPPADGMWHHRLGMLHRELFGSSGDAADLERAVQACRLAVDLTAPHHGERVRVLAGLAAALHDRFEYSHVEADLAEAEALARLGIADLPARSSLAVALRLFLKMILESRLAAQPEAALRAEVLRLAGEISTSTTAPPLVRAIAAQDAAVICAEASDWREAADNYELAVSLLPLIGPDDDLREAIRVLKPGRAAAHGAACWLNADEPERAAVLLEHGRAVFISRTSATRADLAALRATHPDLADKFEAMRAELDRPDPAATAVAGLWEAAAPFKDRAAAAAEFEELLATIRGLPGHQRFLQPPTIQNLLDQSAAGPVILLNASTYRCDALVLTRRGVRPVPLPEVSVPALAENAVYIQMAGANADDLRWSFTEQQFFRGCAVKALAWIWDKVVEPVLKETGITSQRKTGPWPRIWWVPGGGFAWLPIHAAGHHDEPNNAGSPALLDRAQSSYVPSVSMLARIRAAARQSAEPGKVLAVAMPKTPGCRDLPAAMIEARLIAERYPTTILGTIDGASRPAIRANIMDALSVHRYAHFACHAVGDWEDPWRSSLLIQSDQPGSAGTAGNLYLKDIASLHLQGQRFGCLSACAAARPTNMRLLDEALQLTSGLLVAGYTHVVGTLWEVDDQVAAEFTREIYVRMEAGPSVIDPTRAAAALHDATRELREKYLGNPILWASHIYSGP